MGPAVLWSFTALGFLAVLLDGFDTVALAFSLPSLSAGWHVAPADFSVALVMTNIGAVAGYILSGRLSVALGPKRFLWMGVAWYGLFTLLVAATLPLQSVALLAVLRLVTGLGLGAVLPVAIALGSSHAPRHLRERIAVIVVLGLAVGATVGGFVGGALISSLGVRGVFWVAGALPFLVVLALVLHPMPNAMPVDAADGDAESRRDEARVGKLFTPRLRVFTVVLWVFAFVAFLTTYIINSWVPTLLKDYGFTAVEAPLGIAMYNLGGIIGTLLLIRAVPAVGHGPDAGHHQLLRHRRPRGARRGAAGARRCPRDAAGRGPRDHHQRQRPDGRGDFALPVGYACDRHRLERRGRSRRLHRRACRRWHLDRRLPGRPADPADRRHSRRGRAGLRCVPRFPQPGCRSAPYHFSLTSDAVLE